MSNKLSQFLGVKVVKKESKSLKDIGGVVGIPSLGQFVPKK